MPCPWVPRAERRRGEGGRGRHGYLHGLHLQGQQRSGEDADVGPKSCLFVFVYGQLALALHAGTLVLLLNRTIQCWVGVTS